MTEDLKARARDKEDGFVERKSQGIKPSEIREAVCAFANSTADGRTGVLFIGTNRVT
jgi:predicted HTH transcriptional regulator